MSYFLPLLKTGKKVPIDTCVGDATCPSDKGGIAHSDHGGSMSYHVLVCDSKNEILPKLEPILRKRDAVIRTAKTGEEALARAMEQAPDVMISSLRLSDMTAVELCRDLKAHYPYLAMLIIADRTDKDAVLEALRAGAHDFIEKPFDAEEVVRKTFLAAEKHAIAFDRFRHMSELKAANDQLLGQLAREYSRTIVAEEKLAGFERRVAPEHHRPTELFLGQDDAGFYRREELLRYARSSGNCIFLTGEKSTGKRTIGSFIHHHSPRKNRPFLSLNCNHPNTSELEREFCGFEKNSFPQALESRAGVFEMANGGTVFLKNVHTLPMTLQGQLLNILKNHAIRRLGSERDVHIDIRMIATSHVDLSELVHQGRFLEELYDALQILEFPVPPLRERGGDILKLADSLLSLIAHEHSREVPHLDPSVEMAFMRYPWTGNLRELRSTLERMFHIHRVETFTSAHLPETLSLYMASGGENPSIPTLAEAHKVMNLGPFRETKEQMIRHFEEDYLVRLLAKYEGNISASAREAGIERSNFLRLIRKYNIKGTPFRRTG